ncbi:hypothetical protein [Brachybacterium tyrofermentans]|uniref:hypothetical protein n=1 Tax=Brachybacterium tyrofermentans TaxID=47848 RepID=UPI003F90C861
MTTKDSPALLPEPTTSLRDIPPALYTGLAIGVLGFVVSLSSTTTSEVNGIQTACSYQDYGAMIAAALCLVCAVSGIVQRRKHPYQYPVQQWIVHALAGVLAVLAVVHALRGFAVIGGPC